MPSCHLSYRFVTLVSLDHVEGLRMGHNKEKVDICLFALFRTASDGQQSDMRGIGGMGPGRVATQIRQHFPRDCRDGSVDVPYQTQTNRLRIHILPRNRKSVHRELTLQRRGPMSSLLRLVAMTVQATQQHINLPVRQYLTHVMLESLEYSP